MAYRGSPDASVRSKSPEIPESDDIVTEEALVPSPTSSTSAHAAAHVTDSEDVDRTQAAPVSSYTSSTLRPIAGEDDEEETPGQGDSARDWVQRKVQLRDHAKLKQYDRLILEMVGPEIESNEHLSNCSLFNKTRDYSSNSMEESSDSHFRSIIIDPR
ncbi:hypothetical protein KC367_g6305 [Hortaea werneckii]|nr:hypothetical protein KC315_g5288 [Hortaea werneckii]KAI7488957.1 hypothetical protein KC351_g1598 [Hortaea werneckii]KAI7496938.1 hypothetical protein KC367_g6305 [Hortaea werneckii]